MKFLICVLKHTRNELGCFLCLSITEPQNSKVPGSPSCTSTALILYIYSDQKEISSGSPETNRHQPSLLGVAHPRRAPMPQEKTKNLCVNFQEESAEGPTHSSLQPGDSSLLAHCGQNAGWQGPRHSPWRDIFFLTESILSAEGQASLAGWVAFLTLSLLRLVRCIVSLTSFQTCGQSPDRPQPDNTNQGPFTPREKPSRLAPNTSPLTC